MNNVKFKLKKNSEGKVTFLMRTGKDLVKSQMNVMAAQHIIDNGQFTETVNPEYPIAIDDHWFFEGEEIIQPREEVFERKGKKK